jgi:hypothetical protein
MEDPARLKDLATELQAAGLLFINPVNGERYYLSEDLTKLTTEELVRRAMFFYELEHK